MDHKLLHISASDAAKLSLSEKDPEKSIRQNVAIILRTYLKSCPMYRQFGIDASLIDRPIPAVKVLMFSKIREAVEAFEPRVRVIGVDYDEAEEMHGILNPIVEVEIISES